MRAPPACFGSVLFFNFLSRSARAGPRAQSAVFRRENKRSLMPTPIELAVAVLDALPQTQCRRCGYVDCAAYAHAIAHEGAPINQCPPGGQEGVARLSAITGRPVAPLNPENGCEAPRQTAIIDEDWCIGCTLCVKACPVDCIVGGSKRMHTVIEADCTGCGLCVPACPVDCIAMQDVTAPLTGWQAWSPAQAAKARAEYAATQARRQRGNEAPGRRAVSPAASTAVSLAPSAPASAASAAPAAPSAASGAPSLKRPWPVPVPARTKPPLPLR